MAFAGPSIGPWQIAEMDVHLINEVLRQIEEQVKLLRGLGPTTVNSAGQVITGTVNVGPHSHETVAQGGLLSHDDALVDVSTDDHHAVEHDHGSDSEAGPLAPEVGHTEGWQSSNPIDFIQAGTGVTITESDESGAITLSASAAALTVEEEDGTPSVASVDTIKVTNGTLTDNGGGSVSLDLSGSAGTEADDVAHVEGAETAQILSDQLIERDGIQINEGTNHNALYIRAKEVLMNGDEDTPEPIFASGEMIYA